MVDCLIFLASLAGFLVLCVYISFASKNAESLNRVREEAADEYMILRMEDYATQKSLKDKRRSLVKAA